MSMLGAANWAVEPVRDAVGADVAFVNHTGFMRFDNDVMRATVSADTLRGILARSNEHLLPSIEGRSGDSL